MSKGILGGLFDFNHDGEMSAFESAAEFGFLKSIIDEEEKQDKISELESEGLDMDDLSMMDYAERREAIEDAGLDPDDYDFD